MSNNKKVNDWTVMVYLAGENSLAEEMVYALKSMKLIGSEPGTYEAVALYDGGRGPVTIEIGKSSFDAEDVMNLHVTAEKNREIANEIGKEKLTEEIEKLGKLREKTEMAAVGAQLPNDFYIEGDGENYGDEMDKISRQTTKEPDSDGPMQEVLKLISPEPLRTGKSVSAGTAATSAKAALSDSAQAFLKDALKSNSQLKALDLGAIVDSQEDLQYALEAMERGNRIDQSVRSLLADFVIEAIKNHKAKNYMLVLSGHGSGAVGDFLPGNGGLSSLTIPELKDALAEVKEEAERLGDNNFEIGILGFDSCLMGMAEVAYEVRDYVHYLVGSEGFEPNTGWPYDLVLNLMKSPADRDLEKLPGRIVEEYVKYYGSDYTLAEVSTHLCAMNLKKIDGFAKRLEALAERLRVDLEEEKQSADEADAMSRERSLKQREARPVRDAVILAHWEAQGFKLEQHVDLWDFCDCLEMRLPGHPVAKECTEVKSAIINSKHKDESLVLASGYCGPAFQHSHGLSIFFPWTNNTDAVGTAEMEHYAASLDFAEATGWHKFVRKYHKVTQRDMQPGDGTTFESTLNHQDALFTGKPGKFGPMNSPRFGPMNSPRFGPMNSPRFGPMNSPRFGPMNSPRFGPMNSPRFGPMNSPRFSGGGGGGLAKIESMKNPPTKWQMQKPK